MLWTYNQVIALVYTARNIDWRLFRHRLAHACSHPIQVSGFMNDNLVPSLRRGIRVKIDGGLGVRPPWSSGRPPGKVPKWGGGSVLGNFQLNNSLTQ